ncbi:T9SS type A sorting domain-containing protein [candidate division WOR-3 bacterium]|nr:T9SS type A sorting domain-containing protein [candidate division WOR-3 bacterium]
MQKLLFLVGLVVFPITAVTENLLINPGFDEAPWDTSWTIDTSSSSTEGAGASVDASPDTCCHSFPRSCKLFATAGAGYHFDYPRSASAGARVFQEITPVINCTCMVYFKNGGDRYGQASFRASWSVDIFVKINNEWVSQWSTSGNNLIWTKWGKIFGASDRVSGIKFCASTRAGSGDISDAGAYVWFWIDDAYISGTEVGMEEEERNKPFKFEVSPNPFRNSVFIRYSLGSGERESPQITIYDLSGKVIKETLNLNDEANQVIWDGKDKSGKSVATGVYFVRFKISGRKFLRKIIKL